MYNYKNTLSLFALLLLSSFAFSQAPVAHFTSDCKILCLGAGTGQIGDDEVGFTYDGTGGTPTTYSWIFQGGSPATSASVNPGIITFNVAGTYLISLTATNANGSSTFTDTIFVINNCSANFAIASGSPICAGSCVNFIDKSNFRPDTWSWTFQGENVPPAADTSYNQNPQHICYNSIGRFSVQLTTSRTNSKCFNQASISEQINVTNCTNPDNCSITYTLKQDTAPHKWDLLYTANGKQPITYTWNWGDGSSSTSNTATHVYAASGYYTICATMVDDSGCTSTYCDTSTYMNRMENNNGMVTVNVSNSAGTATAVRTVNNKTLSFQPNPAKNQLAVSSNQLAGGLLEITNILGSTLITQRATANENVIDVSNLTPGVYFLSVKYINGGNEVRKFVKE